MILLLHTATPDSREQRSKYVRSVFYDTLDEIPQLLSTIPGAPRTGATPSHQERQRVKIARGVQLDSGRYRQAQQTHVEMAQDRTDDITEAEAFAYDEEYEQEVDETPVDYAEMTQEWAVRNSTSF